MVVVGCGKQGKLQEQLVGTHIVLEDGLDKGDRIVLRNPHDNFNLEGQWNTKFTKTPVLVHNITCYYSKEEGGLIFWMQRGYVEDKKGAIDDFKIKCVFDGVNTRVLNEDKGHDYFKDYKFSKEN